FVFFQAEDGIRDLYVTGVQTCALPIFPRSPQRSCDPVQLLADEGPQDRCGDLGMVVAPQRVADVVEQRHHYIVLAPAVAMRARRSEERRVGKECRARWAWGQSSNEREE